MDNTNTPDDSSPAGQAGRHKPIWFDTTPETGYEALDGEVSVDTAVIGGGIAGITTAYELRNAGQSVALIERDRILCAVTGRTTAKLTSLHGLLYAHLCDHFGQQHARQYANANEAAIDQVETTIEAQGIDCEFVRTPAYTYVESETGRQKIREEVDAARRLGLPVSYVESTDLPYDVEAAVEFTDQARFNPRRYLLELTRTIPGDDSHVFERTTVRDVTDGTPCRVTTDHGAVIANDVVIGTHFPIRDPALYFARLSPKRSYVLGVRLATEPPKGLYYDPEEPYFSVRPHPDDNASMVLIGGQNHRTGHGNSTKEHYRRLERQARERFDVESIEYRWATQDYVAIDHVPFVGRLAPQMRHLYVATGFGGWGMTNGTAAGRLLSDLILDRENPYRSVYQPTRLNLRASAGQLLSHNVPAAKHRIGDRIGSPPRFDRSQLDRDEAVVVTEQEDPVAAYRDESGRLHAVSAICPHMGCLLRWNDGEKSWDCPCHGSRFDIDGTVLDTPAVTELDRYDHLLQGDRSDST
ncbi:FAD-dependent oxidoreductase [Halocatena pleomorpha]|uniref:FAD-dependent oxidoreductase n=1 Tax=Halocatena pleomorpha TaxID=1785090 RepID=A0A3P3RLK1_9EURY|nr:FAD-dependent oxidoreductase [Halocatena pleomorpha]RRJ33778.1 FAD-dependent oxidoreductase [Halocatena pleomorpha]